VFFNRQDLEGTQFDMRRSKGYVERIAAGAFDAFLATDGFGINRNIVSYFNHDSNRKLGDTRNGTLEVSTDDLGLKYSIPINANDPDHLYVAAKIAAGLVRGSSIDANVKKYRTSIESGARVLTVTELSVTELGPVSDAAYSGTNAITRHQQQPDCPILLDFNLLESDERDAIFRERIFTQCLK